MMPSAAKWQLKPGEVVSVVGHWSRQDTMRLRLHKLYGKWQEKLRRTFVNFKDALVRGIECKALKKDNLEKHELSVQHRDAVPLEKGPQSGTCLPLTFTQSQMMTRTLLGVMAMEWVRILDKCNRASFMHACYWVFLELFPNRFLHLFVFAFIIIW